MQKPPATLMPELDRLLASRPQVADAIRRVVGAVRPCVRLRSERVGTRPIRGRWFDRLLGREQPAPLLPATASKFGGVPYVEREEEWQGGRFLGQVNFAEVALALSSQGFPIPDGMPERGLLAVDMVGNGLDGRVRWYPAPQLPDRATTRMDSVATYEAAIRFEGSWSLRGLDWFDAVAENDNALWDYMNDLEIAGVDLDAHDGHKLFGHANEALNEHDGLTPVGGRSASIRDYALVWRIDGDAAAGFSWGTHWLYVVIHRDDLASGAFENAIVTGANA